MWLVCFGAGAAELHKTRLYYRISELVNLIYARFRFPLASGPLPLAGPAAFGKTAQLWPWLFIHWVRSRSQPAPRHHRSGVLWRHFSCLHVIEGINYAHVEIADHSELKPDPDPDPARASQGRAGQDLRVSPGPSIFVSTEIIFNSNYNGSSQAAPI